MSSGQEAKIETIVRILRNSRSLLFITGAGISADSGLPTYRGIGGLYNDRVTEDGIPIEVALAGSTLYSQPQLTWKYLLRIESNCRTAKFNLAHEIIAKMEKCFERVWVLTQNIDGFHHLAGSLNVIDIHGDMHELLCMRCNWKTRVADYSGLKIPPLCPRCNSFVRPGVVFFGEQLPDEKLGTLSRELKKGFDIYFSIGTSSVFPYIQEPLWQAKANNKPVVEINPGETEVSEMVDIKLSMGAKDALEEIWREFECKIT